MSIRMQYWLAPMVALMVTVGCGGGEETSVSGPTSSTVQAADDEADVDYEEFYDLDVIAEAEPDEGEPPLTVQFLGYVEEETGAPWTFAWRFGDGSSSTEQNPVHTYEKLGEYTAVLTVTDQEGQRGTDEIDVFVEDEDY